MITPGQACGHWAACYTPTNPGLFKWYTSAIL
jgi:hypothetical protein